MVNLNKVLIDQDVVTWISYLWLFLDCLIFTMLCSQGVLINNSILVYYFKC